MKDNKIKFSAAILRNAWTQAFFNQQGLRRTRKPIATVRTSPRVSVVVGAVRTRSELFGLDRIAHRSATVLCRVVSDQNEMHYVLVAFIAWE